MRKTQALVGVTAEANCPSCSKKIDLLDKRLTPLDDDAELTTAIFDTESEAWNEYKEVVNCPYCKEEFTIEGLEY
jgi:DNA-directed RNA polymerase subunit RPC12/RpoP